MYMYVEISVVNTRRIYAHVNLYLLHQSIPQIPNRYTHVLNKHTFMYFYACRRTHKSTTTCRLLKQ